MLAMISTHWFTKGFSAHAQKHACMWTLSKWVKAFPATKQTASVVAFLQEIIPRWGIPTKLSSNNGTHFVNQAIQEVSAYLGMILKKSDADPTQQLSKLHSDTGACWPALFTERQSPDATALRSVVLQGLPIVLGDDSSEVYKTCFDTAKEEALASVTVGVLTVVNEGCSAAGSKRSAPPAHLHCHRT
ncbi:hypothetical protein L3Q82_017588 [Scortum barcoo]|uniref:Uncharacterized protein n=1 Tax=Scortum barcoo TaxID=214431 RepID=A0ACB8VL83_9TELE|nr:hypothetical protein L3Q82_017588 [Scortum barcoo]